MASLACWLTAWFPATRSVVSAGSAPLLRADASMAQPASVISLMLRCRRDLVNLPDKEVANFKMFRFLVIGRILSQIETLSPNS